MAKVTGPLMSFSASGKLASSIVFAAWKGVSYVRQYVIPANPQSSDQGDRRIMAGGTGRSVGKVQVSSTIDTKLAALSVIPSGQSKQSYLVQYILDHYLTNATTYTSELASCTGHTAYTSFQGGADDLGITAFDLTYAAVAPYDKALGIFLLAKSCIALGFTGAPYTDALSAWTATDITGFIADFTG